MIEEREREAEREGLHFADVFKMCSSLTLAAVNLNSSGTNNKFLQIVNLHFFR